MTPPQSPNGGAHAEPLWFLRVNPLRRFRLGDPDMRVRLAELAEAERSVRATAGQCSDELYEQIGAVTDDASRRRLVELRRTIHNDRVPRSTPEDPTPAVRRWFSLREQRQVLREDIARRYPEAAGREREALAGLLADEDLRRALTLAAPEVYQEAERYRQAVAGVKKLSARVRKSERGLLQFVTRAMLRTSPLSRFTAVGIAEPDESGTDPGAVEFGRPVAFPSLDRVMLGYVLGGLHGTPDDEQLPDTWVGLSPTSAVDEDSGKLFFLRPTPAGLQRLGVAVSPPLRLLLDATSMGLRPVKAVLDEVAARSGRSAEETRALVFKSIRQGILCSFPEGEDGSTDLREVLDRPDLPAAARLTEIRERLPRFLDAPAPERGRELAGLRDALAETSHQAGRPAQITVAEDYVVPPLKVSTESWQRPLRDLGSAVDLLTVFDWLHDVRVYMTAAFVQRFGAGANVSLAEHAPYLVSEVTRRAAATAEVYGPDGSGDSSALAGIGTDDDCLAGMYELRRQVTEEIHAHLTKAADAGDETLTFAPADVDRLVEAMPERFRRDPLLYGVLVQQSGDQLVVNDGLPGHGMLYARFLEADRQLGGNALPRLADRLQRFYGADGSRVVEDYGLHGMNVNAHARVLPQGLEPDDWFTLRLRHDADTDELRVEDADGVPLRVLPLGTGHPGLYPPPLSVASGLVISGRLYNGMAHSWHGATPWDGRTTRVCPRIAVGDVVVSRRRWYGGDELDTAVATGPDEHDRLLALTAWRSRYDVPEEVVVKTAPADDGPLSVSAPDTQERRLRQKPQYVDLTSALGTRVLPRMLDRRSGAEDGAVGFLEEALPGVADGTHATEWVVEVGRRPGGRFRYGGDIA